MYNLYNRIKDLCDEKGVTIYRMCKDSKVSPSVITDIKMGRQSGISTKNALKISEYFSVPISYLLGDTDDPTDRSKTHWAEIVQDDIPEDAIKAAFFKGADMTKEEMDAAWQDAKDYIAFKSEQRRRGGGK